MAHPISPHGSHIREDETITVNPVRVLRVEAHELVEQDVGHGGHAHRGTRVTGVGLGGGINLGIRVSQFCVVESNNRNC